ncbi:hypothetical protein CV093_08270 [Oceanobacillus sp. 143]|uniref:DUF5673 domain-containing protein n=1 Tax=Oceanobacillus zhaokaii TaxID=2052660 RepID=A0A345PFQ7_9BACI|nr:hypothetical protein [Oceanobacillus zhaokaii]AXI08837.1 hypothetical protein CUC15_07880 [Oceanobacillus zhaokaii]QGS68527.1 hypothetical protein CV093_08270 [Oceanobacillus sp. 143]
MELFIEILIAAVILFYIYRFVLIIAKMKEKVVFPTSSEGIADIRKFPQKIVNAPTYFGQKWGLITYAIILAYVITMFCLVKYLEINWATYLLVLLPLFNFSNLLNMFVIVQDGILCGGHFVSWKKIKTFEFVLIDANHRYYGHSEIVNNQYEIKIKTGILTLSSIITSEEMRKKLRSILYEHNVIELGPTEDLLTDKA